MAQGVIKSNWRSGGKYLFQIDHNIWGKGSDFLRFGRKKFAKKGFKGDFSYQREQKEGTELPAIVIVKNGGSS